MAPQTGKCFDGATTLTEIHDSVQAIVGNATWVSQLSPVVTGPEIYIAEALLYLFYKLGLCCAIVSEFAMYIGGKPASYPELIIIYTAYHPQNLSPEIAFLVQITHTPAFRLKV